MTIETSEFKGGLSKYRRNPNAVQRTVYNLMSKATNGRLNVLDPSNPFSLLLEASTVMTADAISEMDGLVRNLSPAMVTDMDGLYGHIADVEYVGVWGTPSTDTFTFAFSLDELRTLAKPIPDSANKKITIPRETKVTIGGYDFGFAYPIDIVFSPGNTISVVYDASVASELMTLTTNVIDYKVVNLRDVGETLLFQVTGMQYSVNQRITSLSQNAGFSYTSILSDNLYQVKVYHRHREGNWLPLVITHSGRTYDNTVPTATLKYADGKLTVAIPSVYFNSGLMGVEVRIDTYTTMGDVSVALGEYSADSVQVEWADLDPVENGKFSAPMGQVTFRAISGESITSGGRNALTFEELKNRTVRNSTYKPVPVTPFDLNTLVSDNGYNLNRVIDNITDRRYLATREMPAPTVGLSSSPIGVDTTTLRFTPELLGSLSTVSFTNKIWSIMPDTLYKREGTGIVVVTSAEADRLNSLTGDALVNALATNEYFYSPFLTVLDTNGSVFNYNNYYIDKPTVGRRYFQGSNSKVDYGTAIKSLAVSRSANGYELEVIVSGSGGHENLHPNKVGLQLAYRPSGQEQRVYLEGGKYGRNVDGDIVFRFFLDTSFEVHSGHNLYLENFGVMPTDNQRYSVTPETDFDFIHYVTDVGLRRDSRDQLDSLISRLFAPGDAVVLTHEVANIRLFESLEGLIKKSRVSISEPVYEKWPANVPKVWGNVLKRDPATGIAVLEETSPGVFGEVYLHRKGDPVLDGDGNQVFEHLAGTDKTDEFGNKIVINSGSNTFFIEQVLFDARYKFANAAGNVEYLESVIQNTIDWTKELTGLISGKLLPRTTLNFAPKTNVGELSVETNLGEPKSIKSNLSVRVDLYVTHSAYTNLTVRETIEATVKRVVLSVISETEVSTGSIQGQLRDQLSEDVVTLKVHSFNNDPNLDAFIITDTTRGCSLATLVERQADGTIGLVDDIDIQWFRHKG